MPGARAAHGHRRLGGGAQRGATNARRVVGRMECGSMGAGGAGAAVADALIGAGAKRLSVIDPQPERAEAVVAQVQSMASSAVEFRIGTADTAAPWLQHATGLVNASPVGMFSHPGVPVYPAALHSALWVADIVYRPARTQLIEAAQARGCAVMPGGAMAVGQAADTFELVTGKKPDRSRMRKHLDTLIAAED